MLLAKLEAIFPDPDSSPALIRRLLTEYGLGHWRQYAIALLLMGISAGCTSLSAYLIGQTINIAYLNRSVTGIVVVGLVIIVLFTVRGMSSYGHALILARMSNRIIAENQRRVFAKLLNESLAFFADRHSSEFIARIAAGATAASQVLNLLITAVGRDFLQLLGLIVVMIIQDPIMSIASLALAPPAILMLRKLVRRIKSIARSQFSGGARMLETMQEAIVGIRIVKAFALEEEMQHRLNVSVAALEHDSNKMARLANRSGPLMETLGGIAVALAVMYGGYRTIVSTATPGEFFSFIAAFLLAYEPAKRLARLNMELNSGLVGVRLLFELIDGAASEPLAEDRPAVRFGSGRIEFVNVCFAYRKAEPVLGRMSFVAEPGKLTALVGPSGSGKSTVLALLLRFYDADDGQILIDGHDISAVSRRSLRRQLAYVGQNVHLFRGTIRENIAFGRLDASEAEIFAAAKAAYAHEFIMGFPAGYATPVGEHGLQLSGGQRQRIAIARALVKNAPIILLDEATASLDSESERQIQEAIAHLCHGRTTLVIAHRLHTIVHADRIFVIEDGTVVESGRHDDLLRRGGRYASFYRLQFKDQAPVTAPVAIGKAAGERWF